MKSEQKLQYLNKLKSLFFQFFIFFLIQANVVIANTGNTNSVNTNTSSTLSTNKPKIRFPLVKTTCKSEIEKYCQKNIGFPSILGCLSKNIKLLGTPCKDEINYFYANIKLFNGFLYKKCKPAFDRYCSPFQLENIENIQIFGPCFRQIPESEWTTQCTDIRNKIYQN